MAESEAMATWHKAILSSGAYPEFDEFRQRVEASSLGTPNAQAARATVSDETAAAIVQHAFGQLGEVKPYAFDDLQEHGYPHG